MGLSQDAGVIRLAILETIEDVFDAIAGVFELCVEGLLMMMAMILQALYSRYFGK